MASQNELLQDALAMMKQTSIPESEWLQRIWDHKYASVAAVKTTNHWKAHDYLEQAAHVPVPVIERGQRCVFFSNVTDSAVDEFSLLGSAFTAMISADIIESSEIVINPDGTKRPGKYYVTDEQIFRLRYGGARVEAWCDGSATPVSYAQQFAMNRHLDGVCAQYETLEQYDNFIESGVGLAIGNPACLLNDPRLQDAIDRAYAGTEIFIGEVMYPDPGYSAMGIPIKSVCLYVDRDQKDGGYCPLDTYMMMPASLKASACVYAGAKMSAADWDTYAAWTK